MCAPFVSESVEARLGVSGPPNWSYGQLWAATWMLGIKDGRAARALNHWAISPGPWGGLSTMTSGLHTPRNAPPTMGWSLPNWSVIEKKPYSCTSCGISSIVCPSSLMTLACVKLTHKTSQYTPLQSGINIPAPSYLHWWYLPSSVLLYTHIFSTFFLSMYFR